MSAYLEGLKTHASNEGKPFAINTVLTGALTGALTYGGQYLPRLVEIISFNMSIPALAIGSIMTATSGNLATTLGKTFLGESEDEVKNIALQVVAFMLGASASIYFVPRLATLVGVTITSENAIATALASTVASIAVFSLKTFITNVIKTPEEDDRKQEEIKDMDKHEFDQLWNRIKSRDVKLSDPHAARVAKDRAKIYYEKHKDWDKELYNKHLDENNVLNFDAYAEEATDFPAAI